MKAFILNKVRKQAARTYSQKSFDELFFDVFGLTYLVRAAASIFSLVTGFYFLLQVFGAQLSGTPLYGLAGATILMLESLKYYITPKAFMNIFSGNFGYGVPSLLIALPLYAASVFFTVSGVEKFFDAKNDDVEVAVQEKEDLVSDQISYYDNLISREQAKYDAIFEEHKGRPSMRWKTTVDQLEKIENRIDSYISEKADILKSVQEQQEENIAVVKEETNALKDNTIWISLASESLLFLAFLFSQYYLFRSYADAVEEEVTDKVPVDSIDEEGYIQKSIKIKVPVAGVVKAKKESLEQTTKKVKRIDQVRELLNQGVTDRHKIAEAIGGGMHPNYVTNLIAKIKKEDEQK